MNEHYYEYYWDKKWTVSYILYIYSIHLQYTKINFSDTSDMVILIIQKARSENSTNFQLTSKNVPAREQCILAIIIKKQLLLW